MLDMVRYRLHTCPAVFKDAFVFCLVSPPPGDPGEGPDWHFPAIPARIREEAYFHFDFGLKPSWDKGAPSGSGGSGGAGGRGDAVQFAQWCSQLAPARRPAQPPAVHPGT